MALPTAGSAMSAKTRRRPVSTGRICLELIATVHGRFSELPEDDLADQAGLADWLTAKDLVTASPPRDADVADFQGLREAIFRLVSAAGGGPESALENAVALVNKHARGDIHLVQLIAQSDSSGGVHLTAQTVPPTVSQVLTTVARDAVDLLTGPDAERLHQCQADTCGSFYLDSSRGRQRRWCSSASCGNRERVAAFRDRNRA
ncbi:CGNR zinc finger domain-containing protein [Actinophytocola sp.]|uniref:CGNR zinc finger domain-containing protein n=1 Tax=Actinophytocola sp. TaxID=1872138 RepID=UPI002ED621F2